MLKTTAKTLVRFINPKLISTQHIITKQTQQLIPIFQNHSLNNSIQFKFSNLPSHEKLEMPALSPTMTKGNLMKWLKKEGDKLDAGDVIADVETDKATVGFEVQEPGYLAKILVPEGTKNVEIGTLVAIVVSKQSQIEAFANFSGSQQATEPAPEAPKVDTPTPSAPPAQEKSEAQSYPKHEKLGLPALSPTMEQGNLLKWLKKEGDKIESGDVIAEIETDKATVGFEVQDDTYLAKILVDAGTKNIKLGTTLAIATSKKEDVPKFSNYTLPTGQSAATEQPKVEVKQEVKKQEQPKAPQPTATPAPAPAAPKPQQPKKAAAPVISGNPYTEIPISNVRSIIASRLLESKTTIPHYYLTVKVSTTKLNEVRQELNKTSKVKISVNDLIIKASALALRDIPEVNQQWCGDHIKQFTASDVSMAVSNDSGLITPIVFGAQAKGLQEIAETTKSLIKKARENKLKPQEFQGGTFTVSNLGMFGIDQFIAVINPPQACILAVGQSSKVLVPVEGSEDDVRVDDQMSATLSLDHRVVDGAVGAQWLQRFKMYIENPQLLAL